MFAAMAIKPQHDLGGKDRLQRLDTNSDVTNGCDAPTRNEFAEFQVEAATLGALNNASEASYLECECINDSFPFKLHIMISEIEEQGQGHVVSWQPHGRCFVVHNRKDFVKEIMPTFFRMKKYESFQRQLNIYGFNRMTTGRDRGGYYHESFVKGRRDLCYEIQRQKVKGTFVRKPAVPENEPNFYKMGAPPQRAPNTTGQARLWDPANGGAPLKDVVQLPSGQSRPMGQSLLSMVSSNAGALSTTLMQNMFNANTMLMTSRTLANDDELCFLETRQPTFRRYSLTGSSFYEPLELQATNTARHYCNSSLPQQFVPEDLNTSFDKLLAALRGVDPVDLKSYTTETYGL